MIKQKGFINLDLRPIIALAIIGLISLPIGLYQLIKWIVEHVSIVW